MEEKIKSFKELDTENKRLSEENQQQSNQIMQLKERLRTPFNDDEDPALQAANNNISNNPKETVSPHFLDPINSSNGTMKLVPVKKIDDKSEVKVENQNNHENAHANLGDLNGDDLDKSAANKPADVNDKPVDEEDNNNGNNIDNNNASAPVAAADDEAIRKQL